MENTPAVQQAKRVVLQFQQALDSTESDYEKPAAYLAGSYLWRGYHPFGEIKCADTVLTEFWRPLRHALSSLQRRTDVFFAGVNALDVREGVWVVSMGNLMGLFDRPWLGIQPTSKLALLRSCEFHRVADGRIVETAHFFDIPHLMMQAGYRPFAEQTAAHLVQPGPRTHDGVLLGPQSPQESERTLTLIEAMIADLGQWQGGLPLAEELARTWTQDMVWWGPAGIGATYTIQRYAQQHSGPFRAGFADRSRTHHVARLAEGHYGGFFGWPNFTARPTGGFMGMPASDTAGEFRVMDIYRRAGDRLAENWVFIDLLHFCKQQGMDILARSIASGPG